MQLAAHFLGDFRVALNGRLIDTASSRRTRALVAYLLSHPEAPVPRDFCRGSYRALNPPDVLSKRRPRLRQEAGPAFMGSCAAGDVPAGSAVSVNDWPSVLYQMAGGRLSCSTRVAHHRRRKRFGTVALTVQSSGPAPVSTGREATRCHRGEGRGPTRRRAHCAIFTGAGHLTAFCDNYELSEVQVSS
jgi:hypothetical protein